MPKHGVLYLKPRYAALYSPEYRPRVSEEEVKDRVKKILAEKNIVLGPNVDLSKHK